MSFEKDIMVQVGFWASLFIAISTFWWRLTRKFVKKDLYAVHLETINANITEGKKETSKLWEVITEARDVGNRCETILQVMANNKRKRKND